MTDTATAPTWREISEDPVAAYTAALGAAKGETLAQIPRHMQPGLCAWILLGVKPGGFLCAVLENNLVEAFTKADDINSARIRDFAVFLYCYAPCDCWGSPEKVAAWRGLYPREDS